MEGTLRLSRKRSNPSVEINQTPGFRSRA